MKNDQMKASWRQLFEQEKSKDYYSLLTDEVNAQRQQGVSIFPRENDVFNAFTFRELQDINVVILGQDPYHGEGTDLEGSIQPQAHGLAFSVNKGIKLPPSLVNIFKELTTDIAGFEKPEYGDLTAWAKQGALLLNTVLTVQQAKAHSHAKLGWETFTDAVIDEINEKNDGCVFLLWGSHAHKKGKNINQEKHLVLKEVHPSPLSAYRGFFGCQHFSKANEWLLSRGKAEIDWCKFD